ncbi:hypothetical protein [Lentzea aerocolonigenes]|uniref:hypothetical protein n=1 Tax=Lentzea aerocolonigenes TaxID=68170 RepID=UPI000A6EA1B3|nr:hypothetical protein [Lentzea aerocolonigenes]
MALPPPRTRLGQLAQEKHLSKADFVGLFIAKAKELGEKTSLTEATLKRWYTGTSGLPLPATCRVLVAWFGEPIEQLFGPPSGSSPVYRRSSAREFLVTAGRESSSRALKAAAVVNPRTLKNLHSDARSAARRYMVTPPEEMFAELVHLRDNVHEQITLTEKLKQKAELFLLAGQTNGLLSVVAWDLGADDVARSFLNSADLYAENIEELSLSAWLRAQEVTINLWSGDPHEAVRIATEALEWAPVGTARARLHSVRARALALIGARGEVITALGRAAEELERAGGDEFLDRVGGELGFDRSRHALCAGASYVALGDGERGETAALDALDLFAAAPESERWGAGALGATIDLSMARTQKGDLAGAEDALLPVFDLEPQRRTEALNRRLSNLGRLLGARRFMGALEAGRITEQIAVFTTQVQERTDQLSIGTGDDFR